ncbi:hypothetical protein XYCOK13_14650 [Xylanibacillus composti]|uniref:Flagellar hook-length control protein-like C-terminal domain-containing protein n=1 Tax=Xylanibacillus composti TaxID=1572762 RepID=A0A8J4H318_9BACL|nr:flagellar hook-length control protein FliK [Xylanibacillus composti]GIQ68641.1 hypothetical protein XYCOK13_14650 [Xylanibacillus composti]
MNLFIQGAMVSSGTTAAAGVAGGTHSPASEGKAAGGGFSALLGAIMGGQSGQTTGSTSSGSGLLAMLAAGVLVGDKQLEGEWALTASEVEDALAQLEELLARYSAETGEDPIAALMGLPVIADWLAQVSALQQSLTENGRGGGERTAFDFAKAEGNDSLSKLLALAQWLDRASATHSDNQQLQNLRTAFDKLILPVLEHAAKAFPELHQAANKLAAFHSTGSVSGEELTLRNSADQQPQAKATASAPVHIASVSSNNEQANVPARVSVADLQWPSVWNRHQLTQAGVQLNGAATGDSGPIHSLTADEAAPTTSAAQDVKPALPAEPAKPSAPVAHANQLVKDMNALVVKQLSFQKGEGFSEARITLMPEHLGQVTIKLTMMNGQLTAHFVAETMAGRELLDSQLSQLRASLQNQGIQVEKLEVTQQTSTSAFFQDQRERDSQQRFHRPQQGNSGGYDSWDDSFDAALEETAQTSWLRNGTSFEVTA